jgi:tryptophan halogenase
VTTAPERAIRSVLVAGGGITALSAAIAFARALPNVSVSLLETPLDPGALVDRLPGTMASVHGFHRRIGVDEVELVRSGAATHVVGTRFENWGEQSWYHVHGDYGLPGTGTPFHWIWLAAWKAGKAKPFHLYSAPAALAAAERFIHPVPDPASPLHAYDYDLRLDPSRYCEILSAVADRYRITRERGGLEGAERREDGGLAAVRLKDGRRIEADLFIDACGPSAPLLSIVGGAFESWSEALPCDRLLLATSSTATPTPTDSITAMPWGWRWTSPGSSHSLQAYVYASTISSEREVRIASGGDAEAISFRPGRRSEPWARNVLAIGDAAVVVDPLYGAGSLLALSAIQRALDLLPGRDCYPLTLREYNRLTEAEALRARDFLSLHYLASSRRYGPFWKAMAKRDRPNSLAHILRQWTYRSQLPFYQEASFTREGWHAVLLGMGVMPRHIDYRASALDPEQCALVLQQTKEAIAKLPTALLPYPDYLRRMIGR